MSESSGAIMMIPAFNKMVRAWCAYALAGAVLMLLVVGAATLLADGSPARAVSLAAAIAYMLQLIAFALLLPFRDRADLFLAGWVGGMVIRFGALGGFVYWVTRFSALPQAPLLLGLVGCVFLLLLLEPVFLRWDLRRT